MDRGPRARPVRTTGAARPRGARSDNHSVGDAGGIRIGINLLFLIPGVVGGTETYAVSLLRALAAIDPVNHYVVFVNRESASGDWAAGPNFEVVCCPVDATSRWQRYAWEQAVFPRLLRRFDIDVLHSLGYVAPLRLPCRSVVTIHDLNYEAIPAAFTRVRREVLRFFVPRSARRADAILTLSESSRFQILDRLGVPQERVVVTPVAAKPRASASGQPFDPLRQRLGIRGGYVLAFSSLSPHKNVPGLIRAFAGLPPEARTQLVLAGHEPAGAGSLRPLISDVGVQDEVIFTGYLPDEEIAQLLENATAFAFPSFYEGFGIPVLEAMEVGTPVVSSNAASLPEVVGDAGILFDPHDGAAIGDALRRVLLEPDLRAELAERGRRQVARFTWGTTAALTLGVYKSVAAGNAPAPAAGGAGPT